MVSALRIGTFLALFLGQPAHDHVALQDGQVVDEQDPVQVIDLVLQAGGEKPVCLDFLPDAGLVEVTDLDPSGTGG